MVARCLHLANWEPSEQPEAVSSCSSGGGGLDQLLQQLQLCSLDPESSSGSGSMTLGAVGVQFAALAAKAGQGKQLQQRVHLQRQLPAELLLEAAAAGSFGLPQGLGLSAWSDPDDGLAAVQFNGRALAALLQLLSKAALSQEQRGALLLAAARAATAGGNTACTQRLLSAAEGALSASSSNCSAEGSLQVAGQLLLRLLHLQAKPGLAADASGSDAGIQAWQLLLTACSSGGACSSAVVPPTAGLLLSQLQRRGQAVLAPSDVAGLAQSSVLPRLSSGGSSSVARLEQLLLNGGAQPAPQGMQYAVLKAAVAAAPGSALHWWRWAAWLAKLAKQQQQQQQQGAISAAAFTVSCKALSLSGSGSHYCSESAAGSDAEQYGALPALLAVLALVAHDPGDGLPEDAAAQLAAVPATAWLPVVQHLVSQLTAGDSAARQDLMLGVLLHVGEAAPCQVLLPAMVAAADEQPHTGSAHLTGLLEELQQRHPHLAAQLHVLVREAARLAVLPEEHWHAVLLEAAVVAAKRLQARHKQKRRGQQESAEGKEGIPEAAASDEAASQCYLAAMAPVLFALRQQLHVAEAATPQTPHESRFRQQHLPRLHQLLRQLEEPLGGGSTAALDAAAAGAGSTSKQQQPPAVVLLRAAAGQLSAAAQQKQLSLADVAPTLAALTGTAIPIPGADGAGAPAGSVPELAGVTADVSVLPTKTRPKRLLFAGSDGRQYAFLLKVRGRWGWLLLLRCARYGTPRCAGAAVLHLCTRAHAGSRGPAGGRTPHATAARLPLGPASPRRRQRHGCPLLRSDATGQSRGPGAGGL